MPEKKVSYVNIAIVALNVAWFLLLSIWGDVGDVGFAVEHGAMYAEWVVDQGKWYMLFTCMFYHFSIGHLANNMIILFFIGNQVEELLGHVKYFMLYFLAGLTGGVCSMIHILNAGEHTVSGGASGAVFGVIGALLWIVIRHKGRMGDITIKRMILMLALSLYYGFAGSGIDNIAHVGGLIAGFLLSVVLYRKPQRS
ncbi:MAG: rhomboid family intramembrane serine protease [Roseburia sp.]